MMKLKFAFCIVGICLFGCTPTEPSKKSASSSAPIKRLDQVKSFPDAVKQLHGHVESISKAFSTNQPDEAHHSLHDVNHLLESIPDLAKDLSNEKRDSVKKSVDELVECYGALDESMHGGTETPYSKVGERIATAMAVLRSAIE